MLFAVSLLALNGYVHHRIRSNRTVTRRWALALSVMDAAMITAGIAISSSGFQNTFFVLYYPALAMFAVVFTSFRLSFAWATMVAVVYAALSLVLEPGVDYGIKEEKVLFTRVVVLYAVVGAVNLVSRFERTRRREAVERKGSFSGSGSNSRRPFMTPSPPVRLHDWPGHRDRDRAGERPERRGPRRTDRQAGGDPRPFEVDHVGS